MPVALVTGATGLVGSHLVERLDTQGWEIRVLARDAAAAATRLPRTGRAIEVREGDVLDPASIMRAAQGCSAIVHAAALIRARDWESYRTANVEGTRNVIVAAERVHARLLHVSSVAVYGPDSRYAAPGGLAHENIPLLPLPERAFYARSKRESEELVLSAHAMDRLWATTVRPDVVYGRRDRHFIPRTARLLRVGVVPLVAGGRTTLPIVHAANVADGAVRALLTDAAGGRAFNLANDYDVTVADFVRLAGNGLGRQVRTLSLPTSAARTGVALLAAGARLVGGRPLARMARGTADFVMRDNPFSSDLARRELGWNPPVHPEEGLPDAYRWWRDQRRSR